MVLGFKCFAFNHVKRHYSLVTDLMKTSEKVDFFPIWRCAKIEQPDGAAPVILVISPHPDDDVIGMGGAMRLFADEGKKVFSVYVTDGASESGKSRETGVIRRAEALAALKTVRASGAFFLHHASSALRGAAAGKASRQLQGIIALLQPVELYLPSPFERHPTHRRVTRITLQALKIKQRRKIRVWGYSVWGGVYGLPGTKAVDISRCLRIKRKAIRRHASQTAVKPYGRGILGRNAYEGIYLHTHDGRYMEAAETFIDIARLQKWKGAGPLMRAMALRHD